FNNVKNAGRKALNVLLNPIESIKDAFDAVWSVVENVISSIRNISFPSMPGWMRDVGGVVGLSSYTAPSDDAMMARTLTAEKNATSQLVAPATFGAPSGLSGPASNTAPQVHVTVQGAVDPIGTARQIER